MGRGTICFTLFLAAALVPTVTFAADNGNAPSLGAKNVQNSSEVSASPQAGVGTRQREKQERRSVAREINLNQRIAQVFHEIESMGYAAESVKDLWKPYQAIIDRKRFEGLNEDQLSRNLTSKKWASRLIKYFDPPTNLFYDQYSIDKNEEIGVAIGSLLFERAKTTSEEGSMRTQITVGKRGNILKSQTGKMRSPYGEAPFKILRNCRCLKSREGACALPVGDVLGEGSRFGRGSFLQGPFIRWAMRKKPYYIPPHTGPTDGEGTFVPNPEDWIEKAPDVYESWIFAPNEETVNIPAAAALCWNYYGLLARHVGKELDGQVIAPKDDLGKRIKKTIQEAPRPAIAREAVKRMKKLKDAACHFPSFNSLYDSSGRGEEINFSCGPLEVDYKRRVATYAGAPLFGADGSLGENYTVTVEESRQETQDFTTQ